MHKKDWKTYVFWIALCEAVGLIAGLMIRSGVEIYSQTIIKPPISPPAFLFPIVWTILYALMGISAAKIRLSPVSKEQQRTMNLFIAQLILNFFWPLFFFNLQAFGFALVWLILLWIMVFLLIFYSYKVDKIAAWLLLPYLIWLTFAVYLNAGIWVLN